MTRKRRHDQTINHRSQFKGKRMDSELRIRTLFAVCGEVSRRLINEERRALVDQRVQSSFRSLSCL